MPETMEIIICDDLSKLQDIKIEVYEPDKEQNKIESEQIRLIWSMICQI